MMDRKKKSEVPENRDEIISVDCSVGCYDPYISGYFYLEAVREHRPLTEEEQARFEKCAQVMQKRRELWEFDRWLEESFGTND